MDNVQDTSYYFVNKVCETIVNGAFCTVLVLGNSSVINMNEVYSEQQMVCERESNNIYKTFTTLTGISCDLPGYTSNNMTTCMESISMDVEKMANIEKLDQIAKLEDGWDGDSAKAFSFELLQKVRNILMNLSIQPELFPTACDTLQIEYEHDDGSYLEIEIPEGNNAKVFSIDSKGKESHFVIKANWEEINKVVCSFYG